MGVTFKRRLQKPAGRIPLEPNTSIWRPGVALQLTEGRPNFKLALGDSGWVSGKGRTLGFKEKNPLLELLDDGTFVANKNFGLMVSDSATTGVIRADGLTLTLTDEDGFLGSRGNGALSFGDYDTVSATMAREYELVP